MSEEIEKLVKKLVSLPSKEFIPGKTRIRVAGKVFDYSELINGVKAVLDCWWTEGSFSKEFTDKFKKFLGVNFVSPVNSGSSANLLAFTSLTSPLLGDKRIKPGDEVITVAACFPTTVNPIIQNGCVPVFLDVKLGDYNINTKMLEQALTPKTKAVFLAHTLGNPFDLNVITEFCKKNNLWLIEDCCDALGSRFDGKLLGSFGDLATFSFYPAHHITAGEGGAVVTNNPLLDKIIKSVRDWGRDCYCDTGHDDTCGRRFSQQHGKLPFGYDHKYVYSHIGYNLKWTDIQASIACAQMNKLPDFIGKRKENFEYFMSKLKKFEDKLILPTSLPNSEPSWFGLILTLKNGNRNDLIKHLEEAKIATRLLFAGNITRQPYFEHVNYRIVGSLENTDVVMNNSFWIGLFPEITKEMIDYVVSKFDEFFNKV